MRRHLIGIGASFGIIVGFVVAGVFRFKWELDMDFFFLLFSISVPGVFFASLGKAITDFMAPSKVPVILD